MQSSPVQTDATLLANNSQHRWMLHVASTGVASFSISSRPGWLSFPHILKVSRMINPPFAPQHFELLSFLAHPTTHNLLQAVDWSNKKFVGRGLQVYGLATPLGSVCTPCSMFLAVVGSYCAKFETDQTFSYVHWRKKPPTISGVVDLTNMWWSTFKSVQHRFASLRLAIVCEQKLYFTWFSCWRKCYLVRGGSRGREQGVPPPPSDDLRFSNTTGILRKKNYMIYWCWSRARNECTPS